MYIFLENKCFQTIIVSTKSILLYLPLYCHANDYFIILSREFGNKLIIVGFAGWENTTRFSTSIVAKLTTILPEELQH